MAKQRFPNILTVAVTASITEALIRATTDELMTQSDYVRVALRRALIADGYYQNPPRSPNGSETQVAA